VGTSGSRCRRRQRHAQCAKLALGTTSTRFLNNRPEKADVILFNTFYFPNFPGQRRSGTHPLRESNSRGGACKLNGPTDTMNRSTSSADAERHRRRRGSSLALARASDVELFAVALAAKPAWRFRSDSSEYAEKWLDAIAKESSKSQRAQSLLVAGEQQPANSTRCVQLPSTPRSAKTLAQLFTTRKPVASHPANHLARCANCALYRFRQSRGRYTDSGSIPSINTRAARFRFCSKMRIRAEKKK